MLKSLKVVAVGLLVGTPLALSVYANSNEIGTDDSHYNNCLRRLEDNSVCFKGMTEDDYHELYQANNHITVQSNNKYVPSEHNYSHSKCEHGKAATKTSDGLKKKKKMIIYEDGCVKYIK